MAYWTTPADEAAAPPDWIAVGVFFGVAALWSAVAAHWGALQFPANADGYRIDNSILVGFGPVAGGVAADLVRPRRQRVRSMFGLAPAWVVLALLAPVVTMAVFGLPGRGVIADPQLRGAVFAASVVIYCFGEELGWRGWLFDALAALKLWQSALVTAALWYAWHWTFLADTLLDPRVGPVFALGTVIASFGLAAAVRRTRATGLAVAWHAAVKLLVGPFQSGLMLGTIALANWAAGRVRKG